MADYTVLKPIPLRGKRRLIGDIVGDAEVDPGRAAALIRGGYIAEIKSIDVVELADAEAATIQHSGIAEGIPVPESVVVPIAMQDDGSQAQAQALVVTPEALKDALWIMQLGVNEAEKEIANLQDENALILINACDSRKGVKTAAEKQAKKLVPEELPKEPATDPSETETPEEPKDDGQSDTPDGDVENGQPNEQKPEESVGDA